MKVMVYLFSLLVLVLSAMPCADTFADNGRDAIYSVSAEEHHSHEVDHTDHCSPFCICNCCQTPVKHSLFFSELKPSQSIALTLSFPIRDTSFASDYCGNIWQPPKH